jgi:hypothetical protein
MNPASEITGPTNARPFWSLKSAFCLIALLWIVGWFVFPLQTYDRPSAIPGETWGLVALFAFTPPFGLVGVFLILRWLKRRQLLLKAAGTVCAIVVLYAMLSTFRYDYIRMDGGGRYTQIDTWLDRQRLCTVFKTGVHCFQWR